MTFERYVKLPKELQEMKEKLRKEAQSDKKLAEKLKGEEMVNPWIITEIDLCGNPIVEDDEG